MSKARILRTRRPLNFKHVSFGPRSRALQSRIPLKQRGAGMRVFSGQVYQKGHGAYFHGFPYQRGHGLGSFFGGLFRAALPLLKGAARALGEQAITTGLNVFSDVGRGKNFKQALKHRGAEAGSALADRVKRKFDDTQEGSGGPEQVGAGIKRQRKPKNGKKGTLSASADIFTIPIKANNGKHSASHVW